MFLFHLNIFSWEMRRSMWTMRWKSIVNKTIKVRVEIFGDMAILCFSFFGFSFLVCFGCQWPQKSLINSWLIKCKLKFQTLIMATYETFHCKKNIFEISVTQCNNQICDMYSGQGKIVSKPTQPTYTKTNGTFCWNFLYMTKSKLLNIVVPLLTKLSVFQQ